MIAIIGNTGVGKDTITNILIEKYNYKKIVTYTTRPKRQNEIDDVTYHFISDEKFDDMLKNNEFAEYTTYKTVHGLWRYGTKLTDCNDDDSIIIINPDGLVKLLEKNINIDSFLIRVDEYSTRIKLIERGDNIDEINRRIREDYEKFHKIENYVNHIMYNIGYTYSPEEMARRINNDYLEDQCKR